MTSISKRSYAPPERRAKVAANSFTGGLCQSLELLALHPTPEELEEYYLVRFDWQQRQKIESHLAHCDSCIRELRDLQDLVAELSRTHVPRRKGVLREGFLMRVRTTAEKPTG